MKSYALRRTEVTEPIELGEQKPDGEGLIATIIRTLLNEQTSLQWNLYSILAAFSLQQRSHMTFTAYFKPTSFYNTLRRRSQVFVHVNKLVLLLRFFLSSWLWYFLFFIAVRANAALPCCRAQS